MNPGNGAGGIAHCGIKKQVYDKQAVFLNSRLNRRKNSRTGKVGYGGKNFGKGSTRGREAAKSCNRTKRMGGGSWEKERGS